MFRFTFRVCGKYSHFTSPRIAQHHQTTTRTATDPTQALKPIGRRAPLAAAVLGIAGVLTIGSITASYVLNIEDENIFYDPKGHCKEQ